MQRGTQIGALINCAECSIDVLSGAECPIAPRRHVFCDAVWELVLRESIAGVRSSPTFDLCVALAIYSIVNGEQQ